MGINYKRLLDLELLVMGLVEEAEPDSPEELERISEDFHQSIEIAIQDQCEELPWFSEYNPAY